MEPKDKTFFNHFAKDLMAKFPTCFAYLKLSSKTGYNHVKTFDLLFEHILG